MVWVFDSSWALLLLGVTIAVVVSQTFRTPGFIATRHAEDLAMIVIALETMVTTEFSFALGFTPSANHRHRAVAPFIRDPVSNKNHPKYE